MPEKATWTPLEQDYVRVKDERDGLRGQLAALTAKLATIKETSFHRTTGTSADGEEIEIAVCDLCGSEWDHDADDEHHEPDCPWSETYEQTDRDALREQLAAAQSEAAALVAGHRQLLSTTRAYLNDPMYADRYQAIMRRIHEADILLADPSPAVQRYLVADRIAQLELHPMDEDGNPDAEAWQTELDAAVDEYAKLVEGQGC